MPSGDLRVVLDSSVLVSAFLTRQGAVAQLLRPPIADRYRLCLSDFIMAETADVLLAKTRLRARYRYADETVRDYIAWLLTRAEMVGKLPDVAAVLRDPKDDPILATAVAAQANYLVTGDRAHLLPLGTYANIRIVSPRDFIHAVDTDAGPQERPPVRNTRWAIDQRCTAEGPS